MRTSTHKKMQWGSSNRSYTDGAGVKHEVITHAHEPGKLYTRSTQASEDLILNRNQRMRIEKPERDLSFGRHVACVPLNDYEMLKRKFPELASTKAHIKTQAWAKILKDPNYKKYLVVEKY